MPHKIPVHRPFGYLAPEARRRLYEKAPDRRADIAFYNSPAWTKLRRAKLRANPLCERCKAQGLIVAAKMVHHVVERKADPSLALAWENLMSLCPHCHSSWHARNGYGKS
jgi:5-methylcytosine-specific restriction enzyme A